MQREAGLEARGVGRSGPPRQPGKTKRAYPARSNPGGWSYPVSETLSGPLRRLLIVSPGNPGLTPVVSLIE